MPNFNGEFRKCKKCSKKFYSRPCEGNKRYCSAKCYGNSKKEKLIDKSGYILIHVPAGTPNSFKNSEGDYRIREHRYKMQKKLGRPLKKWELVHHINENKSDNRVSNLMLVNSKIHHRIHRGWKKIKNKWFKPCSGCKKLLEVNKDNFWMKKIGRWYGKCKICSMVDYNKWKAKTKRKQNAERVG